MVWVNTHFETAVEGMNLPAGLKSRLLGLSATARANVDEVTQETEKWFADFITPVQHWYVRRAQAASLSIGLLVALYLNNDTIDIAKTLYHEPAKRDAVVRLAVEADKQGQCVMCPDATNARSVKACLDAIETSYPFRVGRDYAKPAHYHQRTRPNARLLETRQMPTVHERRLHDFHDRALPS